MVAHCRSFAGWQRSPESAMSGVTVAALACALVLMRLRLRMVQGLCKYSHLPVVGLIVGATC
jgi:hypothetical protein